MSYVCPSRRAHARQKPQLFLSDNKALNGNRTRAKLRQLGGQRNIIGLICLLSKVWNTGLSIWPLKPEQEFDVLWLNAASLLRIKSVNPAVNCTCKCVNFTCIFRLWIEFVFFVWVICKLLVIFIALYIFGQSKWMNKNHFFGKRVAYCLLSGIRSMPSWLHLDSYLPMQLYRLL
jgi:hypothetical protein